MVETLAAAAAAGEVVGVLAAEGGATTGEVAAGRRRPRFETKKLERPRLDRMRIGEYGGMLWLVAQDPCRRMFISSGR